MAEQDAILVPAMPLIQHAARSARDARLRKHADYQRVYAASRKHFSPSVSYFYALRSPFPVPTGNDSVGFGTVIDHPISVPAGKASHTPQPFDGPRVGLTAGRVLGKAVDRNRIKRRMREVVRKNLCKLTSDVDVILHPRKFVISLEYTKLDAEVGHIFDAVEKAVTGPDAKSQFVAGSRGRRDAADGKLNGAAAGRKRS